LGLVQYQIQEDLSLLTLTSKSNKPFYFNPLDYLV
jgi:hypothetical protein